MTHVGRVGEWNGGIFKITLCSSGELNVNVFFCECVAVNGIAYYGILTFKLFSFLFFTNLLILGRAKTFIQKN